MDAWNFISETDTDDGPSESWDWNSDPQAWSQDQVMASLHPLLQDKLQGVLDQLTAEGWQPRIRWGWRPTSIQAKLAREGKSQLSVEGPHTQTGPLGEPAALAADVYDRRYGWGEKREGGQDPWRTDKAARFFSRLGQLAEQAGLSWGGRFSSRRPDNVWAPYSMGWDPAHVYAPSESEVVAMRRQSVPPTRFGRVTSEPVFPGAHVTWHEVQRSTTASRLGIDNTVAPEHRSNVQATVQDLFEPMRAAMSPAGLPITNFYRTPSLNSALTHVYTGVAPDSRHLLGLAFDTEPRGDLTNEDLATWLWLHRDELPLSQAIIETHTGHLHVARGAVSKNGQFLKGPGRGLSPWHPSDAQIARVESIEQANLGMAAAAPPRMVPGSIQEARGGGGGGAGLGILLLGALGALALSGRSV